MNSQGRFQSSYVGNLARRVRDVEEVNEVAHLKELYRRNDPDAVIRSFESQPSLHSNPAALAEYVKALVKVERLDGSELLKTLQRGGFLYSFFVCPCFGNSFTVSVPFYLNYLVILFGSGPVFAGISKYAREEESLGSLAAFKNVGKPTKDGFLGTASAPIHMVSAEGGNFKEQLWRTVRTIALAFLLISGVGALIEDKGISKGISTS